MTDSVPSENYQDPDRADNDATTPGFGPDSTLDLLEVGTSFSDEVFNMDPILKIEWVWIIQSWESWLSLPWINDQFLWQMHSQEEVQFNGTPLDESSRVESLSVRDWEDPAASITTQDATLARRRAFSPQK